MKSVYVAARSKELVRAKEVMRGLEKIGFSITFDWTEEILKNRAKYGKFETTPERVHRANARQDVLGVLRASTLVLLLPQTPENLPVYETTPGSWVELGVKIGQMYEARPFGGSNFREQSLRWSDVKSLSPYQILISGPDPKSIFTSFSTKKRFATDAALIKHLDRLERGQ
jgi:hypothetical protein